MNKFIIFLLKIEDGGGLIVVVISHGCSSGLFYMVIFYNILYMFMQTINYYEY